MDFEVSYVDVNSLETESAKRQQPLKSKSKTRKQDLINYLVNGHKTCLWYSANEQDLSKEVLEIITEFSLGTNKDISFLGKSLIFSRESCPTTHVAIIGLAILSCSPFPLAKETFKLIFDKVIKNGDDLKLFMEVIMSKVFRGFGKLIQKSLIKWLQDHLTPYNLISWGTTTRSTDSVSSSQRRTNSFKMGDIIRLSHIKGRNVEETALYKYATIGAINSDTPDLLKQWIQFVNSSNAAQKLQIVRDNNLPINKVKEVYASSEILRELFLQADFNEIITNLNDYQAAGVFEVSSHVNRLVNILTNPEIITKSKVSPLTFIKVHDTYRGSEVKVFDALEKAAELAYDNLSPVKKSLMFMLDKSNMSIQHSLEDYPNISAFSVGATLTSIIAKKSIDPCLVIPFSNSAIEVNITNTMKKKSTLDIAEKLNEKLIITDPKWEAPFMLLNAKKLVADYIICFSYHSWRQILMGTSAGNHLSAYLNVYGKDTKMIFWQLSQGTDQHYNHTLDNAVFVDGVNEKTLSFVMQQLGENIDYMQEVEALRL